MAKRSPVFDRLLVGISALAVFGAVAWIGFRLFAPVPVPPVPPPKAGVQFDPRADVRQNPLFGTLRAVLRGQIEPGILGHFNPFSSDNEGADSGVPGTPDTGEGLSVGVEEMSLGGRQALALSRANDGAMLVLLGGLEGSERSYEIRRYDAVNGESTTAARWNLQPSGTVSSESLIPVALQQDGFGKLWLLSRNGYVGSIQSDGMPTWSAASVFASPDPDLLDAFGGMAVDGAGRLWLTDGKQVVVGNGVGFETFDVSARLPDALRAALQGANTAAAVPGAWNATPFSSLARTLWLDAGVPMDAPKRVTMLPNGSMSITAPAFVLTIPVTFTGPAEVISTIGSSGANILSSAALGLAPAGDGSVWASRGNSWLHVRATSSAVFADPSLLPRQALYAPGLLAAGPTALYALDYASSTTVLWVLSGERWTGQRVPPAGPQPDDVAVRISVDGRGNVWALLKQKGLLRVPPPGAS